MALKDRDTLKTLFKKGNLPTENSFADIIDSSINKIDDGFSKSMDDGLMLAPIGKSKTVLSVFNKITDPEPNWSVDSEEGVGDSKDETQLHFKSNATDDKLITLSDGLKVGVHNEAPRHTLDVKGTAAATARVGNRAVESLVPADGKWHNVLEDLNYCSMFEIVARTGIIRTGKHAMVHAIAMSSYGNSNSRIRHTHARFSFWRPLRIKLRFTGNTYDYNLQMKCTKNLGKDAMIKFYITELWNDENIGHPEHYKRKQDA